MALDKIRQGNTINIEVDLTNADDETPLKPSDLEDYHIYVYNIVNSRKKLLRTYKKTPDEGEGQVNVVSDDDGTIGCVVNPSLTKTIVGEIYIEVATQSSASSDYEDQLFNDGKTGIVVCEIEESVNPKAL